MFSDKYRVILCCNKARCVTNKSLRHFLRHRTLNWFPVSRTLFSSFWATLYGSKKHSVICFFPAHFFYNFVINTETSRKAKKNLLHRRFKLQCYRAAPQTGLYTFVIVLVKNVAQVQNTSLLKTILPLGLLFISIP